jgi:hypothetical protein
LLTKEEADRGESQQTVNYKSKLVKNGNRVRNVDGDAAAGESDATMSRKQNHKNYQVIKAANLVTGIDFLDNTCKERSGGKLGSKYTMRNVDRETRNGDISGMLSQ